MGDTNANLRQQRLQKLFDDCEKQVIGQLIGPFGLSIAMFEDRDGGNVTTLRNFSREDADYIAERDVRSHEQSRKEYDRDDYMASDHQKISDRVRASGRDHYTGKATPPEQMDMDHVTSLNAIHENKKVHLAHRTGDDRSRVRNMANAEENLAATDRSINRSKGAAPLAEFQKNKGERFGMDPKLVAEVATRSNDHIRSTTKIALLQKQGQELLVTGGKQAMQMGVRQAFGLLLAELVNGLFNEVKMLIRHGVEAGQTLFDDLRQRLARVVKAVARKIPDAVGQMLQGGVSGFMSNLLTFLLNNLVSTEKRFVTAIREGILGLIKACKMILFPPPTMTGEESLRQGLKDLSVVVASTVGLLIRESVNGFVMTVPLLAPFADIVALALVGILTGLVSAFAAYQIDCLFDRHLNRHGEKFMDELLADAGRRATFASELVAISGTSLENLSSYARAIDLYDQTSETFEAAKLTSSATLASLEELVAEAEEQVANSKATADYIASSQPEIEEFLKTI
ncbi:MAG TPA: hypothetical protein VGG99_30005 [Acetobacteraceae bacterium]